MTDGTPPSRPAAKIDTSRPHSARIWNYWLGGKDNYPVDRQVGDEIELLHPGIITYALADRAFLGRAVRYLAEEAGTRQFLDIGTGLPTVDNTHEVAQRVAPEARIVYADNDPLVLVHAQALLTSSPEGSTDYIDADLHDPDAIVTAAAKTLDFDRPIAIMLLGIVNFIADLDEAYAIVRRLMDSVPAGSHLAISHTTYGPAMDAAVEYWNRFGTPKLTQRTPEQIAGFFDGMDLLEPGVVSCSRWRPEAEPWGEPEEVNLFCGLARKRA
ncbi:SAM-dependent methyltransferase [Actinoallomurus acanthiterrae]